MGIIIKSKGPSFSRDAVGYVPPISDSLSYWSFYGENEGIITRNLADFTDYAVIDGAPTVNPYGMRCSGDLGFLKTNANDSGDITIICVAKPLSDQLASMVSNYSSGPSGTTLYLRNPGTSGGVGLTFGQAVDDGTDANAGNVTSEATIGDVQCFAGRAINSTREHAVWNLTESKNTKATFASFPNNRLNGPLAVGASYTGSTSHRELDIYMSAVFNKALTDAEIQRVYDYLRGYYGRRNIFI